jgi:hypothetical protein
MERSYKSERESYLREDDELILFDFLEGLSEEML